MAVSDDGKVEEAKASVDEPQPSVALERKPTRLTCERPEFLLIGDSITQQGFGPDGCWGALLANEWTRCADVVNRGFSGYNTRWVLRVLAQVLKGRTPDVVTVWLGANDSVMKERNPKQHVPVDEYKTNLVEIVKRVRAACSSPSQPSGPRIVLFTPPPVDGERWSSSRGAPAPDRNNSVTVLYANAAREVARELDTAVVDIWTLFKDGFPDSWKELLRDGLHLSREGSRLTFAELRKVLVTTWPELDPERMSFDMPAHQEVVSTDLDASFPFPS